MTLNAFLGPNAQQDDLPTAPSGRDDGGFRGRGGGRDRWGAGGRGRRDDPPSRADESNSWRSVRGTGGGGGGGGRWGNSGGGGGSRWRGSQDSRSQDSRFDSRWGGQTQDTRPAYLRNRFHRGNDPIAASRSKEWEKNEQEAREAKKKEEEEKKAAAAAKKEAERLAKHKQRASTYSDNLKVAAVRYKNKKSPLEIAVEDATSLRADGLEESLQRLNFRKTPANQAANVLANALIDKKFTFHDFSQGVQAHVPQAKASTLCIAVFKALHRKGVAKYEKVVERVETQTLLDLVNPGGLDEAAMDKFLAENELIFLKPVADISAEVHAELKNGSSAADILAMIDSKINPLQTPTNLLPIVIGHLMPSVFESKEAVCLDGLPEFAPVLIRCRSELSHEANILFSIQRIWFKAGAHSGAHIRSVFQKLHELEVVSYEGLSTWKDDRSARSKTRGKAAALFGVAGWIQDIAPVEEEDEEGDEGDEGDEEELDEYLVNPNADFYN